jgi:hypothetical protein
LKLGECGNNYQKKDGKLIELVLMNLRTPFDMFISNFHTNWKEHKEDGNDYTFEDLCGILIIDKHILFEEGNIGGKYQYHLIKGKKSQIKRKEDNLIPYTETWIPRQ